LGREVVVRVKKHKKKLAQKENKMCNLGVDKFEKLISQYHQQGGAGGEKGGI
jgi:hypothetical protein